MPELPEVETVKRGLVSIINHKIINVKVNQPKLRIMVPQELKHLAEGAMIKSVDRKAKYLLIGLDNHKTIIIHLGMSGRLTLSKGKYLSKKHDHVIFTLDTGEIIIFNDPRKFGLVTIVENASLAENVLLKNMGCEPLTDDFNVVYLKDKLKNKSAAIKLAIMDNAIVVGVGNIYACEALFMAGINPLQPAKEVNDKKLGLLVNSIKQVLTEAINASGSSFRDYVNHKGEMGSFQSFFKVYDREDEFCKNCSNVIKRVKQGGRSSFFCTNCQK